MIRRIVLADACVLVPAPVCDLFLRLADQHFYEPRWSDQILGEMGRALRRIGLTQAQVDRRVEAMRRAFPDADVLDYSNQLGLVSNHPKDRHVLAAAVAGEADTIVTCNLRHFPAESCNPFGVVVMPPDDLFCLCLKHDPEMVNQVLIEQAVDTRDPVMSQADILANLYRHVPMFVESFVSDFPQPELQRLLRGLRREAGGASL
jgi:predicted nucleic acid-binding protein